MAADRPSSESSHADPDYFQQYLNRTIMLLGEEAVQSLRSKTVAIAGCGGHGGAACLTLARMGVGGFILADPKPFDEPDINRQWGAHLGTMGRNKAEVYAEMLLAINPEMRITRFCDGITDTNAEQFLEGADLLIDCLDVAVPGALRKKLFVAAGTRGLHIFTAAMLGFGGMVAGAFPGGLPLELLGGIEDTAIAGSKLPAGLREVFVPEFMDLIDQHLHRHRVPSIAVSPAILGTILSVEAAVTLLGNTFPGWRPPVCLPRLLLVDLLRMNFRIVHLDDLLLNKQPPAKAPALDAAPMPVRSVEDRRALLASVGYNTNLLPSEAVDIELLTDSWSELPHIPESAEALDPTWTAASPDQVLQGLYGYKYILPVFRGRFAEALLCRALIKPGSIVVGNALFPTTRFHLENNGAQIHELLPAPGVEADDHALFKGDLDLARLRDLLEGPQPVTAIYLEFCNNALGGHPISLANLRAVHELAAPRGTMVILDAARAFENAAHIQQREAGNAGRTLVSIVREMCSYSDACAASCTKDFPATRGGFIAVNHANLFTGLFDLTLGFGDGLEGEARKSLVRALAQSPEHEHGPQGRTRQVALLWKMLRQRGVPVISPAGGHAVYVDARALLSHLSAEAFPAQALTNELFIAGGIRAATNFATPAQRQRGVEWVRLAIPIGRCTEAMLNHVAQTLAAIVVHSAEIPGLQRIGAPPGVAGEFAAEYRPLKTS